MGREVECVLRREVECVLRREVECVLRREVVYTSSPITRPPHTPYMHAQASEPVVNSF